MQSVPGPGELPQTFETVEKIEARAVWNAMKPELTEKQIVGAGCREVYLKGISAGLKPGDHLLIVGDERADDPTSERWDCARR